MREHLGVAMIVGAVLLAAPFFASANAALVTDVSVDTNRAAAARSRTFTLVHGQRTWQVPAKEVATWFKTKSSGDQTLLQLRPGAIYDYLNVYVSPKVNQLGTNSRFGYVGPTLHLLFGGTKGKIVDGVKTSLAFRSAVIAGKTSSPVYFKEHRPSVFSAEDFKKLSFPDKLSRGESNFAGSPSNRVHNIKVAQQRYNGLVLLSNETFSFNQYLGDVDAKNGYLEELVIKENVTTPEYGGGICQVSTTAFRAAMEAGLRITTRRNHSYPVAYYGAPGYDATIYAPYTDLKFTNDTGHPVLIKTSIAGSQLIFDVWGTSDGRQVRINGPFITGRKADGSVTAAVAQFVTKNGTTIREQNFVSNYQSPDKFPTIISANGG